VPGRLLRKREIATVLRTLVGSACGLLALWLAAHYPLASPLALLLAVCLAGLGWRWPDRTPIWLLALLPWIGLMTWTGWLVVEEWDIAVLAVACGGWLRLATAAPMPALAPRRLWFAAAIVLPLVISLLIGVQRGVSAAGGLHWGWWQGYREPLNSVRLAKPFVEVALLLPLLAPTLAGDAAQAAARLRHAFTALLAGVALVVLWERLAFTGLLNFSSDYRAVGPFWEMHVGGAALDVVVSMLMPAAIAGLAEERRGWRWLLSALVAALAFYAALATFSRIVYLSVPLVALVWLALRRRGGHALALAPSAAWLAGFGLLAAWLFAGSGYRGVLALLGGVALLLPARAILSQPAAAAARLPGFALGIALALVAAALRYALDKGAYFGYALAWATGAAGLLLQGRRAAQRELAFTLVLGGLIGTLVALAGVAIHWGGPAAVPAAAGASAALALTAVASLRYGRVAWPAAWRWQASVLAGMVALAAVVGAFAGGSYMEGRVSEAGENSVEREAHWRAALDLLHGTDWLLGKGLGRYWAEQMMSPRDEDQTGDYRWLPAGPGHKGAVVLSSGRHILGAGEELKLSQRIALPGPGAARLKFDVLAGEEVRIDASICNKHLLYDTDCLARYQPVAARPGVWQSVETTLAGNHPTAGPWFAPRLTVFSIALGSNARKVELRGLRLVDGTGRELLRNGDFADGMARWYFTSDRYHLPWHAKNLAVHLLFEQGLLGLAAFLLASLVALWRVTFGAAAGHPAAAMLAAGLVALGVVGAVDSVLDMPRVAFLAYLFVALALVLPAHGDRKQWRSPQSRATLGAGRRLG